MIAKASVIFAGFAAAVMANAFAADNVGPDAKLQQELVRESAAFMDYWKKGDSERLANILAADFVYASPQGAASRAVALDVIGHCQLVSFAFSHVQMLRLSADSAVLIYTLNQDLTCFGQKDPAVTLNSDTFVRRRGQWKIVLTTQTTLAPQPD